MSRRIIGQCNQADFAGIEHLADITENPEMLDVTTLTENQKYAFRFLTIALRKGISWDLIRQVVKEVLFWGVRDQQIGVEIKFKSAGKETREFRRLWGSAP